MIIFLQIWGGVFFLVNKILFSRAERFEGTLPDEKNWWRIWSWIIYLIGLPAWMLIFFFEHNWIALAVEIVAIPSLFLGLVMAFKGRGRDPEWLKYAAILMVVVGIGCSLYDFHGVARQEQVWEFIMSAGFLVGTFRLAYHRKDGYLWYMLMHMACIPLMYLEHYDWLAAQQVASLGFVLDAYLVQRKKEWEKLQTKPAQ